MIEVVTTSKYSVKDFVTLSNTTLLLIETGTDGMKREDSERDERETFKWIKRSNNC